MPRQQHYYGLNHLHYVTTSTYRRARVFDSERFKRKFTTTLDDLRGELRSLPITHAHDVVSQTFPFIIKTPLTGS